MSERGQVLERMTVVRSSARGEVDLEALWQPGVTPPEGPRAPVVIAGHHPRLGGNMDAPAASEIVWQLARAGHATLRFNWRGMGASTGDCAVPWLPSTQPVALDDEVADLNAAVDQHDARVIVGVSFGCAVASRVAAVHPRVERVVLVAPPVDAVDHAWDALFASGVLVSVIVGDADETAPLAKVRAAVADRVGVLVIPHAGHSFQRGLVELGRKLVDSL